jgi:hypothetical protein
VTATPTGPALVTLVGRVKIPGQAGQGDEHGLVGAAGVTVEIFVCTDRKTCLATPPTPIATAVTDANGRFSVSVPADLVHGKLLGYVATIEEDHVIVKIRRLVTSQDRGEAAALASRALQPVAAELDVDPISEAAVLLLDENGLNNYSDDGVDAVNEAVDLANASSMFAGDTSAQAVTAATTTAADNQMVQAALQANRTPTPTPTAIRCVGDCDGSGVVTIDELIVMVNIDLGSLGIDSCAAGDANHDGQIAINEIIAAVNNALDGCPL